MIIEFCLSRRSQVYKVDCLFESYSFDSSNLSYATIGICSRAGAWVISNKCVNRSAVWVQNRLKLGYETTGYLLKDALCSKRLEFPSYFFFFFNRYFKLVNFLSLKLRDSGSFLCFPLKFLSRKLLGGWHHWLSRACPKFDHGVDPLLFSRALPSILNSQNLLQS